MCQEETSNEIGADSLKNGSVMLGCRRVGADLEHVL
jgi:hypothetical protein